MPQKADLLERAHQFDGQALAQIYDQYSPGLYRYAVRLLGETDLAEECVAETFSRFLRALHTRRGPLDYLQAYLYRTAHNWIVDQYRQQPTSPLHPDQQRADGGENPEETADRQLQKERIRTALRRLTTDQQQVIALKFLEGWGNEAIARAMKKPIGAVKSLQHRALTRLQRLLQNEE